MIKISQAVFTFLFLLNCSTHYIRTPKATTMDPAIAEKMKKSKIALVGFYPYRTFISNVSGRTTTFTAVLDFANSTAKFFPFGKPLAEIKEEGLDGTVPERKVQEFLKDYLTTVKKSGIEEIVKMIDFKKIDEKTTKVSLKKRDVDYYVIGIHGPPFAKGADLADTGKSLLTVFPFMLTLGTVPLWGSRHIESEFWVYDNKLNLVKKFEYKNSYTRLIAWWGNSEEGGFTGETDIFRPNLYKPDVIDFSQDIAEIIGSAK